MPVLTLEEKEAMIEEWDQKLSAEGLGTKINKKQIRGSRNPDKAKAQGRERNQATQREITVSPDATWVYDQAPREAHRAPENAIQALMESEAWTEPMEDKKAVEAATQALEDAIGECVGAGMADVIIRHEVHAVSIRELAEELGLAPTTLNARKANAMKRLTERLPFKLAKLEHLRGPSGQMELK